MKNLTNVPEKLTLENFWNQLYADSNGELQHFCDWVDEYKKRVGWDKLFMPPIGQRPEAHEDPFFNVGLAERQAKWDKRKIKFHDLPIGMQVGIVFQYIAESDKTTLQPGTPVDPTDFPKLMEFIRTHFIMMKWANLKPETRQAASNPKP